MTLQQWAETYGETITDYDHMKLVSDRSRSSNANWDLYHLSDYVVVTVQAGTVWLRLRP